MIIDASTLDAVSVPEMLDDLKEAKRVFIGESHDNRRHHEAQLAPIRAMEDAGMKVAIAWEMFRTSDQERLDAWVSGKMPESDFLPAFDRNRTGEFWPLYRPIFLQAREGKIPMIGLNIDRRIVARVSRTGFASLDKGAVQVVGSVTCDAEPKYREQIRRVLVGHANDRDFVRFREAQMLRDAAMAWRLVDLMEAIPGYTVVVLAGGFHSWKHGIPERVRRIADHSVRIILPSAGAGPFGFDLTKEDTDYVRWMDA